MSFSTTAKNLGFHFTDDMRIDVHVQDICRKAYIDIRRISSTRHLLSIDATKTLLSAFVLPKLNYCHSPFYGSPMYMLEKLLKVHNSAARLFFNVANKMTFHPFSCLHWLPIKACIECKLTVICNFLSKLASYLLVWSTLSVHTQKKFMLFFWKQNFLYTHTANKDIWASLIFFCSTHNMEFFAFRAQTYWLYPEI